MNAASEPTIFSPTAPRLSDMRPGIFWCRWDQLPTWPSEVILIRLHVVSQERVDELREKINDLAAALFRAPVPTDARN